MGIKPLYYCSTGQYFLFASEIRTLLGTGLVPGRLDRAALLHYLSFGSVYDPLTAIHGVFSLRAGHYLTWEKGNVRDSMYYDLAPREQSGAGSSYLIGNETARKNLQDDLYTALDQAVRMQMVSDVPVGLFLSGGIDSSALAGILTRAGVRLNTFSVVFREAEYSEAEYSRVAARAFATDHQEILVSQHDALEAIPYALEAMDQPTMDGLNTYLIARQTRAAGIKVALSGLGGDELFAGYSTFWTVPRMERLAEFWAYGPSLLGKAAAGIFSALFADTDQNRKIAALVASPEEVMHPYFLARMLFTSAQIRELLSGVDEAAWKGARTVLLETLSHTRGLDPINRVSYLEARCYMLNTLLRDSDVMSMAHGLELRVPLLDHLIAARLMAMPGAWKLDAKTPKPLLVGALKGALPDEIVHREKLGFTLPLEQWLREDLRPEVEGVVRKLDHGPLASILNPKAVQRIWDDFLNRRTSWSHVWALYVMERWCELNSVAA
jgi:asparagine synthase (glutamine-hydrolysing)